MSDNTDSRRVQDMSLTVKSQVMANIKEADFCYPVRQVDCHH
jgi:hypothetical protein